MSAHEIISEKLAHPPAFGSPTAQAVRAGNFIYVSGMIAWDKDRKIIGVGDVEVQTNSVIDNIEWVLEAAGAKLADIVKITFYLSDIRDKSAVWEVRKKRFGDCRPASTLVEVSHFVDPHALLEVDAVAYLK